MTKTAPAAPKKRQFKGDYQKRKGSHTDKDNAKCLASEKLHVAMKRKATEKGEVSKEDIKAHFKRQVDKKGVQKIWNNLQQTGVMLICNAEDGD